MNAFPTLFTFDNQIVHGFTLRTHLLSTYEFRYMLKRPIALFKVLCSFRIEENVQKIVRYLARLQWNHVTKMT